MSNTLLWTIVLVISIVVEALTTDLVSIWFTIGSAGALIANLFHLSETYQIIIFIVLSFICIIASRPISKKYLRGNTIKTNYDRAIGQHCLVTETITPDTKGEVKVLGILWKASSLSNEIIEIGEYAEVVSFEGAHIVVKKI